MKILICTNHSYMFWQFRRELTQRLLREHEVLLSTPFVGHQEDLAALGCRMVETALDRRGINPVTDWKLVRFYWKLLRREKPDLVLTYSVKPNIYCGLAARMQKIPYYVHVQGLGTAFQRPILAAVVKRLYKLALKGARMTFFENNGNAKRFVEYGIQPAQKQTVLPGAGVNLSYHAYREYPQNEKVHFLYLGRIMKEKGVGELFQAARKLYQQRPDFVLDLVGFYEEEYKGEVDALVADGIAVFHGFQEDPRPYYASADCVVLPSYHEGMSNVLLEAAAAGRPLITSDIPGCMEAVTQESGILVPVRNAEELAAAMAAMLEKTDAQRQAMGRAGRTHMQQSFDRERVVDATVDMLLR